MTDERDRAMRGINDEAPAEGDPYTAYDDFNLPAYVGLASFQKLPWVTDAAALAEERPERRDRRGPVRRRGHHRPGARFGHRAIRRRAITPARSTRTQLGIGRTTGSSVVDAGDGDR